MTDFNPRRFQAVPPVVKNIIIVNVLMVVAQYVLWHSALRVDLADYLGLHYWKSGLFKIWQPVTHIFMHGSAQDVNMTVMHIASNMIGLWIFGSILENVWGSKRFFTFYMVCGLGAALCHMGVLHYEYGLLERSFSQYQQSPTLDHFIQFLQQNVTNGVQDPDKVNKILRAWQQNPGSISQSNESIAWINKYLHGYHSDGAYVKGVFDEATVGASGAVFGVLFAFGYLFPNTELMLIFLPIPIKAKYVVGIYAAVELFMGVRNSAGDNVAHFAHLGGMLFAFILLKIWNKTRRNDFY